MRLRAHPCGVGGVAAVVARGVELLSLGQQEGGGGGEGEKKRRKVMGNGEGEEGLAPPDLLWLDLPCVDHYTPDGGGGEVGGARHFTSLTQVDGACL